MTSPWRHVKVASLAPVSSPLPCGGSTSRRAPSRKLAGEDELAFLQLAAPPQLPQKPLCDEIHQLAPPLFALHSSCTELRLVSSPLPWLGSTRIRYDTAYSPGGQYTVLRHVP